MVYQYTTADASGNPILRRMDDERRLIDWIEHAAFSRQYAFLPSHRKEWTGGPGYRQLADVGGVRGLLVSALALLLLAPADRRLARLLLVHDELGVALILVPLEAGKVGVLELVVGLDTSPTSALQPRTWLIGVQGELTFFLNCLWMASSASLMVTPLRLRAVTSRPKGKCRSIFLMGGLQRSFLRTSLSSMEEGAVLSFLRVETRRQPRSAQLPPSSRASSTASTTVWQANRAWSAR